jgi:hypothetical protein
MLLDKHAAGESTRRALDMLPFRCSEATSAA